MISKGNKAYSILYSKCPKCNEGDIFESGNPYNLKKITSMVPKCKVCGQNTNPEPGFYYGAMYVSYALAVGFGIVLGTTMFLAGASALYVIIAISCGLTVLSPLTFRISRMVWLNFFCHFDRNLTKLD